MPRVPSHFSALALCTALCAGLSACIAIQRPAPPRPAPLREGEMYTEWIVHAPLARVADAFVAVRDSLALRPARADDRQVRLTTGVPVTHLTGTDGRHRLDAELRDAGPARTRVRLRMTYPLPFAPSTPMLHQRWGFKAAESLGETVDYEVVPERIWPDRLSTCVGQGDVDLSGDGVTPPALVAGAEPVYTAAARSRGFEGRVYVQLAIDAAGAVTCAMVTSGLPYGLSESALTAARQWRFRPATRGGQPFAALVTAPIAFRIGD